MPGYENICFLPMDRGQRFHDVLKEVQNGKKKKKKQLKSSDLEYFFPKQKAVKTFCLFLWKVNRKK